MSSIRINGIMLNGDGSGNLMVDVEGLDNHGQTLPNYRQTVLVPGEVASAILAAQTMDAAVQMILSIAAEINPMFDPARIREIADANDAAQVVAESILSQITFPLEISIPSV
jgi:hypothetical protein